MASKTTWTPEEVEYVKKRTAEGAKPYKIAAELGKAVAATTELVDPRAAALIRRKRKEARLKRKDKITDGEELTLSTGYVSDEEAFGRRVVLEDRRSLTGRLLGDPPIERSALRSRISEISI